MLEPYANVTAQILAMVDEDAAEARRPVIPSRRCILHEALLLDLAIEARLLAAAFDLCADVHKAQAIPQLLVGREHVVALGHHADPRTAVKKQERLRP